MGDPRLHILVVDDDEASARALTDLLHAYEYDADSTFSGVDALKKIKIRDYDVVITDMNMPNLSGMDLLSEIKKHDSSISCILMTGNAYPAETAIEAINLEAEGYLKKPVETSALFAKLEAINARKGSSGVVGSPPVLDERQIVDDARILFGDESDIEFSLVSKDMDGFRDHGGDADAFLLLKNMSELGMVEEERVSTVMRCPHCDSDSFSIEILCPECGDAKIGKGAGEGVYKCSNNHPFSEPSKGIHCAGCDESFSVKQAKIDFRCSYSLSEKGREMLS